MAVDFQPLRDEILLDATDQFETKVSKGGVLLPDQIERLPMEGLVVAVGPGIYEEGERKPMRVSLGDRVVFAGRAAKHVELDRDSEPYLLIAEKDIIGIVKK